MTSVSHGKPCAGNPHARFEEGASAPESSRRNALLHTYFKTMTDFEIVKEIDLVLEGRGMRVDVSAYGPPLEETMSKEAIELWKSLDCEGNDNISQIHAITSSDAPKSVQDELINFGSSCMSVGRFMPPPDELPLCSCASERCNWATGL